jgi:hypothetical protein
MTIYATDKFVTTSVTSGNYCFDYCSKLRGGAGTTYDESKTSVTYARIDGGPDSASPGYFTAKPIGSKSKPDAVGDIVFSDGSATPYTADLTLTEEQKAAAIAVIFYVGTECSNDSNSRTLGVGLAQNQSGLAWCLNSAAAYETDITTIQCFASGDAGALTFTGDRNGIDNLSQIGEFLDENDEFPDKNDDTGTADKYPAFYFAKNYASQTGSNVSGTSYEDGWYLPTIAELFQVWKVKETVNAASSLCGGSQFFSKYYWSSSQYGNSIPIFARSLNFSNGSCNDNLKHLNYMYICAVRAFN